MASKEGSAEGFSGNDDANPVGKEGLLTYNTVEGSEEQARHDNVEESPWQQAKGAVSGNKEESR